MLDSLTLSSLSKQDEAALRDAPRIDVARFLEDYLNAWLPRSYADPDDLLYAGASLGRTRPDGFDEYVERWLDSDASPQRFDIAGLFLWGYWPFAQRVSRPLVSRLLDAAATLPKQSPSYASVLLALYSLFSKKKNAMSAQEFEHGRDLLRREREGLRESNLHPGVLDTLAGLG
jgi:hypothetical protein